MRFISTKTHGVLDYLVGVLLILAPWILNFDDGSAAQVVPVVIGFLIILMSLVTNYEMGVIKSVPMSLHLSIDVIVGIFLAISPWLFNFDERVFLPHLLVGLFSIFVGLTTKKVPSVMNIKVHG